ncbi:MAG: TIGR01458 family HAD-type hydrolase [Porticoccaceae bacterium]|nr:TIGR01458 family HAD-type hydrolase [Porticoccaceae bacterium]
MRSSIEGVLFDLDGVFYVGNQPIPGALNTLGVLDDRGIPYRFITNTTTQNRAELSAKLKNMGIPIVPDQLVTAPVATRDYLLANDLNRCFFAVAPAVLADFKGIEHVDRDADAVVVGDIGDAWSYDLLDTLFQHLLSGARLVAMHRNRYWQTEDGLHIDIGAFVTGLEYAAGVQAVTTGKPSAAFFAAGLNSLNLEPGQVIVVGDDIQSDIGGAQQAGIRAVQVKTGKYRQELAEESGITPDWTLDSIAELATIL